VLLPLANWDPERELPEDWAARRIAQEYPFLYRYGKGQVVAGQLLDEGLVSLVLDGLDEMAGEHQEAAVAALAAPTAARVVVLARPEQYRRAAAREPMTGAVVELLPVDVGTAAAYLRSHHGPQATPTWERVASALLAAPESAAAAALRTPLLLVLARETYAERGDPMELLDATRFADAGAVEEHLLDRLVRLAYEGRGPRKKQKYKPAKAQRWLTHLARQMERHNTREIAWWRLWTWPRRVPFAFAYVLFAGAIGVTAGAVAAYPRTVLEVAQRRASAGQVRVLNAGPVTVVSELPATLVESGVVLGYLAIVVAIVLLAGGYGFAPGVRRAATVAPRGRRSRSWFVGLCATLASLAPLAILGFVAARSDGDWVGPFLFLAGVAVALFAMLTTLSLSGIGTGYPSSVRIAHPSARDLMSIVALGLAGAVVVGFIDTASQWYESHDRVSVTVRMLYWLAVGVFVGLLLSMVMGFVRAGRQSVRRGAPRDLWRQDAFATVTAGTAFAVVATLISVLVGVTDFVRSNSMDSSVATYVVDRLKSEALDNLDFLVIWLALWLVAAAAASEVARYAVATTLAWVRGRGPLRLLRFLEDARERQIIRRAGTVYEFRHARLQSRLAQGSAVRPRLSRKGEAGERPRAGEVAITR
jgi:hypothetical protein